MPLSTPFSTPGLAWGATLAGAVGYVGVCGLVGRLRVLPRALNRKLMHIGTGPIYLLFWPLFPAHPASRWLCASVPLLAAGHFGAVGAGWLPDALHLVPGATRHGRREELLRGPLLYGLVHSAVCALCWRHSPSGALALAVLCGGDGLAEVVGRSAGASARRLPTNRLKSVQGSLACWLGGAAFAAPLLARFHRLGLFDAAAAAAGAGSLLSGWPLVRGVLLCSAVGAVVESLPLADVDNITITAATWAAARLYFGF
eukprot:scaffold3.g6744.t1